MGFLSRFRREPSNRGVTVEEGWPSNAGNGFVVFDIETTGLSPTADRILEMGLIRIDANGNPLGYWSTLVNPQGSVGATHIHGIKQTDVANSPTFAECVDQVLEKLKGQVLVAHNAKFDHSFLKAELGRAGWSLPEVPIVCTMLETRYFLPGISRKRLVDCVEAIGINQDVEHRALGDASLTAALFHFYLNGPVDRSRSAHLRTLPVNASSIVWPAEPGEPISLARPPKRANQSTPPAQVGILQSISEIMPEDLLGDEATPNEISYAALLLNSLEDGSISNVEIAALGDCATSFGLLGETVEGIHRTLLLALAREAWRDGVVSRAETQEIGECAKQLGLSESDGKACLKEIEDLRVARIAARSKPIPADWLHGDPLRVGDRVVITGCYEDGRFELENQARKLGVRITGSVSGKTTLLVSDGTINGNKEADAKRLDLRVVGPDVFRTLLEYVQPATSVSGVPASKDLTEGVDATPTVEKTESLVCVKCGVTFARVVARGRKPHECGDCRAAAHQ
jgi:DNA polymerase-3 subunit epsilon